MATRKERAVSIFQVILNEFYRWASLKAESSERRRYFCRIYDYIEYRVSCYTEQLPVTVPLPMDPARFHLRTIVLMRAHVNKRSSQPNFADQRDDHMNCEWILRGVWHEIFDEYMETQKDTS
ncbi:unnamed protein product [Caenorhabditis sp. 36 PRJEB53466]|nr:unnamed protein product [Caenorhabditis sp. 36 PRJEB53466]